MGAPDKIVDGKRFLPPFLRTLFQKEIPEGEFTGYIPWTPLKGPVPALTFSLLTSAGISLKTDPPFDMDRERREPMWGDPTCREIPRDTIRDSITADHLHVDTSFLKEDLNVILPLSHFMEFENQGIIGSLAPTSYSFYGYQHDLSALLNDTMPEIAARMRRERVGAVLITPACPLCNRTVGFVARYLEEQGFSTICLMNIPEFTRSVGIPRVAAVEHPFGRIIGQVHDAEGQRRVLRETLSCLERAERPGEVFHLPFTWPEEPKETKWHPPEISPILKLFRGKRTGVTTTTDITISCTGKGEES